MTTGAPYTADVAPPGLGVAWLPGNAPEGILERLGSFGVGDDDEFWHEERRNACRAYLGTLLNWRPGDPRPPVPVEPSDMNTDMHAMLLADIRDCAPWTDILQVFQRLAAMRAGARYGAESVRVELADCLALGDRWEHIGALAEAVHFCRRRDERAKVLRAALGAAHSPEAVEAAIAMLQAIK